MTTLTRRAPALLLALLSALAGSVLWSAPASAAAPSAIVTYTPSRAGSPPVFGVVLVPGRRSSVSTLPTSGTITAGQSVAFDSSAQVTVLSRAVPGDTAWSYSASAGPFAPASHTFAAEGVYAFEVVGPSNDGAGSGTATGTITVLSAPTTTAPTSDPTATVPGSHPTTVPTSEAATTGSGGSGAGGSGSGTPGSGGPGGSGGGSGGVATTAGSGGGGAPAASATTPIFGGFAPGDFGTLAPEAGNGGAVLPPVIAPYATVTGPDGVPSTLYTTYTPTPSPVAAVSSGSGGGSGRAIGLTGAITAVLLVGLLASLGRLLLAHPAAATRRH